MIKEKKKKNSESLISTSHKNSCEIDHQNNNIVSINAQEEQHETKEPTTARDHVV